jgi:hypothetical protein
MSQYGKSYYGSSYYGLSGVHCGHYTSNWLSLGDAVFTGTLAAAIAAYLPKAIYAHGDPELCHATYSTEWTVNETYDTLTYDGSTYIKLNANDGILSSIVSSDFSVIYLKGPDYGTFVVSKDGGANWSSAVDTSNPSQGEDSYGSGAATFDSHDIIIKCTEPCEQRVKDENYNTHR